MVRNFNLSRLTKTFPTKPVTNYIITAVTRTSLTFFSDINKRHKRSLHVDVQMSAISLTNSNLFPVRLV